MKNSLSSQIGAWKSGILQHFDAFRLTNGGLESRFLLEDLMVGMMTKYPFEHGPLFRGHSLTFTIFWGDRYVFIAYLY